jgi:hypothetical protein
MAMSPRRISTALLAVGAAALCQCSLLVGVDGLDNAGPDGDDGDLGASSDAESGHATLDGGEGADVAQTDGAPETGGDTALAEAAGPDAGTDAGSDAGFGGRDAGTDTGSDARTRDAATDATDAADAADTGRAVVDAATDAGDGLGPPDGGSIAVGLVALYRFDETSGAAASDSSGNGHTATMTGATFASGLQGNSATMNGSGQYVSLPQGLVQGLTAFSVSAWVKLSASPVWSRIFDFGTSTTTYAFMTANSSATTLRFAITTGGSTMEQQMNAQPLPTLTWQHVAITATGTTGTLYVGGAQVAQNIAMTLSFASLGATTQTWLGRSEYATDPYLNGQLDNVRIYSRALTAAEVLQLFQQEQ